MTDTKSDIKIQEKVLHKEDNTSYTIEQSGDMRVPVKLFTNAKLLELVKGDDSVRQACNVATLPGIQGWSFAMPDMHQGYGFPIGGVAAFDLKEGIISPGGIGFDINCGVRLLTTPLTKKDVLPKIDELLEQLFKNCPVGVGSEARVRLTEEDYATLLTKGVRWAVDNGYGTEDDLIHCESQGCIPGADVSKVSQRALSRGRKQLGTVGAGNHFVEVQWVDEIFDEKTAKAYGLALDQVVVLIHCGSRGFGHQVCTDYIRRMEEEQPELAGKLVDKNLIYAPLSSEIAKDYFAAMCAAANYAFANRHLLGHFVRESFARVFGREIKEQIKTVYDICHNIAKKETHNCCGEEKEVMVHRKGATRAFPPGFKELPKEYQDFGQPVLIPGSMGTSSFVLHGTKKAMEQSFGSTAHGAGRMMSRYQAKKDFRADDV
ncbi:RtcB family protein, partial [Candidatus Woesearchaeota archaeon]|nr:RtcB family protein [Candidatus Woesearchaeota archaeon]